MADKSKLGSLLLGIAKPRSRMADDEGDDESDEPEESEESDDGAMVETVRDMMRAWKEDDAEGVAACLRDCVRMAKGDE